MQLPGCIEADFENGPKYTPHNEHFSPDKERNVSVFNHVCADLTALLSLGCKKEQFAAEYSLCTLALLWFSLGTHTYTLHFVCMHLFSNAIETCIHRLVLFLMHDLIVDTLTV